MYTTSFSKKLVISQVEKRKLTTWIPFTWESWVNGTFTNNVDEYIADHIAARNHFIIMYDYIKERAKLNIIPILDKSQSGRLVKVISKNSNPQNPINRGFADLPNSSEILLDSNSKLVSSQGIYIYDSCAYQFFGGTKRVHLGMPIPSIC